METLRRKKREDAMRGTPTPQNQRPPNLRGMEQPATPAAPVPVAPPVVEDVGYSVPSIARDRQRSQAQQWRESQQGQSRRGQNTDLRAPQESQPNYIVTPDGRFFVTSDGRRHSINYLNRFESYGGDLKLFMKHMNNDVYNTRPGHTKGAKSSSGAPGGWSGAGGSSFGRPALTPDGYHFLGSNGQKYKISDINMYMKLGPEAFYAWVSRFRPDEPSVSAMPDPRQQPSVDRRPPTDRQSIRRRARQGG